MRAALEIFTGQPGTASLCSQLYRTNPCASDVVVVVSVVKHLRNTSHRKQIQAQMFRHLTADRSRSDNSGSGLFFQSNTRGHLDAAAGWYICIP